MSAARVSRWSLIGVVLAALILSGCGSPSRRDFPNWRFDDPPWVSDQNTTGQEDMPDVAVNSSGETVVVWSDKPSGDDAEIWWRRYSPIGLPLTPAVRITNNAYSDYYPRIAYEGDTTYLVWMGDEVTSSNIYWAAIDNNGSVVAGPTMISDPQRNDYDPRIYYCGESHVIWNGDTAATNFAIHYAKIADSGTIDLPDRAITTLPNDERDAVGAISGDCNTLHVAYVYEFTLTDDNVYYTAVDTGTGNPIAAAGLGTSIVSETVPVIAVANDANGATHQVNIAWQYASPTGSEVVYASRNANGSVCAVPMLLTNDTTTDQAPAVLSVHYGSSAYVYVAWERTGANANLDIYGRLFPDDCTPTPPIAILISNGSAPQSQDDRYVELVGTRAPNGVPGFVTVWRAATSGRVFGRFGTLSVAPVGTSEDISSPNSAGMPAAPYLVAPELAVGGPTGAQHARVVWLGTDGVVTDVFFQQTAWQSANPVIVYNHAGDAPAPGQSETKPQSPAYP